LDLSIVICTHNRSKLVRSAVEHLLAQQTSALEMEIIVVDNNSTDDTAEVVQALLRGARMETAYLFERAQGISYARNTGWRRARAPIVAFTDDDVEVAPDWTERIVRAFEEHPETDCVGGKVLPHWPFEPPRWLTRDHWAPLAILDYGDMPLRLDHDDPRCLVGANFAFRRSALKRIGGFSAAVQRVKDGIGSIEDHEFLIRLWDSGGHALYLPELVVVAPVDVPRMTKSYHRRWHYGHGHFHAIMRSPSLERSSTGHLFNVPAHLYRQLLVDAASWLSYTVRGRTDDAFVHENGVRFFCGFFQTRRRERGAADFKPRVTEAKLPAPPSIPHQRSTGVR
jgi:glycosyltransferase involved in cell wall biosynthesis